MAREHLKLLEQFLRSFPKDKYHKFDMRIWVGRVIENDDTEMTSSYATERASESDDPFASIEPEYCNTAGCAAGFACSIPEIQAAGLKMVVQYGQSVPYYNGFVWYTALSEFFELSTNRTDMIFEPDRYHNPGTVTPYDVAERIAWVLAGLKDELSND